MLCPEGIAQWLLASWILQLHGTKQHTQSGMLMITVHCSLLLMGRQHPLSNVYLSECVSNF